MKSAVTASNIPFPEMLAFNMLDFLSYCFRTNMISIS